jgi:hypothetical protein
MDNNICFDKTILICLFFAVILLAIYANSIRNQNANETRRMIEGIQNQTKPCPPCGGVPPPPPPEILMDGDRSRFDPITSYDRRKIQDVLTQPTRRNPQPIPPYYLTSLYSRGAPDSFSSIGFLSRVDPGGKDDERKLPLFARQQYPGSPKWEYYTTTTQLGLNIKIPFETRQNELQSDDLIRLKDFDNGEYKVVMYKMDQPVYNPYTLLPPVINAY